MEWQSNIGWTDRNTVSEELGTILCPYPGDCQSVDDVLKPGDLQGEAGPSPGLPDLAEDVPVHCSGIGLDNL